MKSILFILINIFLITHHLQALNMEPYIGVFSERSKYEGYPGSEYSYISASNVKWLEMGGARIVPIPYEADEAYYDNILEQLNGFYFTGGVSGIGV